MAKNSKYDYFGFFVEMMEQAHKAAQLLEELISNYDYEALKGNMDTMHKIEHGADMLKHEMTARLFVEFLPPIDREDISQLAVCQDDLVDSIEEVAIALYMYNVKTCRPEAIKLTQLISACCKELVALLKEFALHKGKGGDTHAHIIEVNRLEEDGDKLHIESMRKLYTDGVPALEVLIWNDVFNALENCCDRCEHVADAVEAAIMKNS